MLAKGGSQLDYVWALLCVVVVLIVRGVWHGWIGAAPTKSPPVRSVDPGECRRERPSSQEQEAVPNRGWLPNAAWKQIVFVDVETTGLTPHDRIVTLAAILLDASAFSGGQVDLKFIHRIYNPEIACHPEASRIHGYSDSLLQRQASFTGDAEEISDFLGRADLVVCHNASFDLRFVNQALNSCSLPILSAKSYCTMENYRRQYDGSARLDSAIARFGLSREGRRHGAFEDAWLTMNLFLRLNGVKASIPFGPIPDAQKVLQNLR